MPETNVRLDFRPANPDQYPADSGVIWVLQATNPIADLWQSAPGLTFQSEAEALGDFIIKSKIAGYDNLTIHPTGE